MSEAVLSVEELSVQYEVNAGTFRALRDVSVTLRPREVLAIVGETGCGKSTLAHAIPRLLPTPPARVTNGRVIFQGQDLLKVPLWKMPMVRGTGIGMIFQEPINSLHPAYRVIDQLSESIQIRKAREKGAVSILRRPVEPFDYSRTRPPESQGAGDRLARPFLPEVARSPRNRLTASADLRREVVEFLKLVRVSDPERILNRFPHELSGGMRQRVMIAMALSEKPSLLIADEPTSALDVTIQAQVLTLMKELMEEVNTSILFISHDLAIVAEMADRVGVMYAGHLIEVGGVGEIFRSPEHPYTKSLLRAIPNRYKKQGPLPALPGSVPNLSRLPAGCPFHPRCPLSQPVCSEPPGPSLEPKTPASLSGDSHLAACYFSERVAGMP